MPLSLLKIVQFTIPWRAGIHLSGVIRGVLPTGVDEGQLSNGYAAHYIETAVYEIKLLNKIVAANPNHS